MGGGGGGRSTLGDISPLVEKAKEELRRGDGRRNVFLSFAYEDIMQINMLRAQAKNENSPIEFNDWSVREPFESERAEYVRQKIQERIAQSSMTVVFLSDSTPKNRWVDWEARKSLELGRKVVAVHVGDRPPATIPAVVNENKIRVIPWSKLAQEL